MPINKYISTKDAVRLTGLSTQEIYDLIHSGMLPARKAPKSGWRISPQDLFTLGLIHEESYVRGHPLTYFFVTSMQTISYHIINILKDRGFNEILVVKEYLTTASFI